MQNPILIPMQMAAGTEYTTDEYNQIIPVNSKAFSKKKNRQMPSLHAQHISKDTGLLESNEQKNPFHRCGVLLRYRNQRNPKADFCVAPNLTICKNVLTTTKPA